MPNTSGVRNEGVISILEYNALRVCEECRANGEWNIFTTVMTWTTRAVNRPGDVLRVFIDISEGGVEMVRVWVGFLDGEVLRFIHSICVGERCCF